MKAHMEKTQKSIDELRGKMQFPTRVPSDRMETVEKENQTLSAQSELVGVTQAPTTIVSLVPTCNVLQRP